jgi:hypothetical protein
VCARTVVGMSLYMIVISMVSALSNCVYRVAGAFHTQTSDPVLELPAQKSVWGVRDGQFVEIDCPQYRKSCKRMPRDGGARELVCECTPTPLVVSFDDQPVAFTSSARFAFSPGHPVIVDWPSAATPWLALDLDGDGLITSGAELFGSDTVLADGRVAPHGFAALAAHDATGDGVINARDPVFGALVLWADRDGDGISMRDELAPLASRVTSIALDYEIHERCQRDSCERERAAMTWQDARGSHAGAVIDVHVATHTYEDEDTYVCHATITLQAP